MKNVLHQQDLQISEILTNIYILLICNGMRCVLLYVILFTLQLGGGPRAVIKAT